MIIIKFWGGLGNQMFQYALYYTLKAKGLNVYADISSYKKYFAHGGFQLSRVFNLNLNTADKKDLRQLIGNYYLRRFFEKYFGLIYKKNNYYFEKRTFGFDSDLLNIEDKKYVVGFWQNELYFKNVEEDLRKQFSFNINKNPKNLACINRILKTNSISIHVRRNDYLHISKYMKIGSINYYNNAINYIKSKYNDCTFFLFSDDIEWVKRNIITERDSVYVDWNIGQESYTDMYLMSLCKHNIITISSFSWWGAWLNNNSNKEVIAPKAILKEYGQGFLIDNWYKI